MKKFFAAVLAATMLATGTPLVASATWTQDSNGSWSWSENGVKSIGWKIVGGKWYYFDQNGIMKTGWQKIGGTWYFLKSSGEMATGWLQNNGVWYYLESWGGMATGWKQVGGNWYYLDGSGAMKTGQFTVDGKTYVASASGEVSDAIVNTKVEIGKVLYSDENVEIKYNGTEKFTVISSGEGLDVPEFAISLLVTNHTNESLTLTFSDFLVNGQDNGWISSHSIRPDRANTISVSINDLPEEITSISAKGMVFYEDMTSYVINF